MIIPCIADAASGIPPEVVGGIIVAVLSASGGWMARGRKTPQQSQSDDTQRVFLEDKFATREEVAEIKQQHRAEVSDLHTRLTDITIKLNEMYGQQNMMIEILKSRKSL